MTQTPPDEEFGSIPIAGGDEGPTAPKPQKQKKSKPAKSAHRRMRRTKPGFQWWKWPTASALSIFIIYLVAGYFLFPYLLTSVFADRLAKQIGRPVTIANAGFNPFTLSLALDNTIIGPSLDNPKDQVDPIFSFGKLDINFEAVSLLKRGVICKQVNADKLFLHLVRHPDSTYNVAEIFKTEREKLPAMFGSSILFSLNNISLNNSRLVFDDRPAGKTHTIEEISLALPAFSNFSYKAKQYIHPQFSAKINGSPIEMTGETSVEAGTLSAHLALQLKDLNLPSYLAYLPAKFDFSVTKGRADLDLDLVFSTGSSADTQLQIKGSGQIADVWLKDAEDNVSRISKAKFAGSFSPLAKKYHLKELTLNNPEIRLDKTPAGNWSFIAADNAKAKKSVSRQPVFEIDRLLIADGKVSVTDRFVTGGFTDSWTDIQLSIDSLSSQNDKKAPFAISGRNSHGTRASGQGHMIVSPFKAEGLLVIEQMDITRLSPYINMRRDLQAHSGMADKVTAQFTLDRNTGKQKTDLALSKVNLQLKNLTLARKNQEWLRLPELDIKDASINTSEKKIDFGRVRSDKGYLLLSWNEKGVLNWREEKNGTPPPQKTKKWTTSLQSLAFADATLDLKNHNAAEPLELQLNKVEIEAELSKSKGKKGEIKGSARLRPQGWFEFTGTMTTEPFSADLECSLDALPLAEIRPLISTWFTPTVTSGILQAKGSVHLPAPSFSGTAGVKSFTAAIPQAGDVIHWHNAIAQDLNLAFTPFSLKTSRINIDKPFLNWILFEKKRSSLSNMFKKKSAKQKGESASPAIDIREIQINDGKLAFADHIVSPAFSTIIPAITGTVKDIRDLPGNRTKFSLQGMISATSPLTFTGDFGFFDKHLFADFNSQLTGLDIQPLATYIEPILGYQTQKGRVSITTAYQQKDNKINADNTVRLDEFKLGKRIDGNVQLPLTVAMFTDSNGRMEIDIPISGNADDPNFSFKSSLTKVFRNLLIKTAVSPFRLLATLFPEKQNIDRLIFLYGEARLSEENRKQLKALGDILAGRPLLKVKINGFADAVCDRDAIAAKLKQEAAQRRIEQQARLSKELSQTYGGEEIILPLPQQTPPGLPPAEEEALSANKIKERLNKLAEQRSTNVRQFLIDQQKISPARLLIGQIKILSSEEPPSQCASRADFTLETSLQ